MRSTGTAAVIAWRLVILAAVLAVWQWGFELGSGIYINPTPPEEAAQFLRDLDDA